MIERLADMPEGTIGFRVDDDIDRDDYTRVLEPALKEAIASGKPLRTLYLIDDLDDIESGALWEDLKLGWNLGVRHHSAWARSAIVTDEDWLARASRFFAWMIPGEARVFETKELEQAKAWVAGEPS